MHSSSQLSQDEILKEKELNYAYTVNVSFAKYWQMV